MYMSTVNDNSRNDTLKQVSLDEQEYYKSLYNTKAYQEKQIAKEHAKANQMCNNSIHFSIPACILNLSPIYMNDTYKVVFEYIYTQVIEDGTCFKSSKRLADECMHSVSTVNKTIAMARKLNLLTVEYSSPNHKGKRYLSLTTSNAKKIITLNNRYLQNAKLRRSIQNHSKYSYCKGTSRKKIQPAASHRKPTKVKQSQNITPNSRTETQSHTKENPRRVLYLRNKWLLKGLTTSTYHNYCHLSTKQQYLTLQGAKKIRQLAKTRQLSQDAIKYNLTGLVDTVYRQEGKASNITDSINILRINCKKPNFKKPKHPVQYVYHQMEAMSGNYHEKSKSEKEAKKHKNSNSTNSTDPYHPNGDPFHMTQAGYKREQKMLNDWSNNSL